MPREYAPKIPLIPGAKMPSDILDYEDFESSGIFALEDQIAAGRNYRCSVAALKGNYGLRMITGPNINNYRALQAPLSFRRPAKAIFEIAFAPRTDNARVRIIINFYNPSGTDAVSAGVRITNSTGLIEVVDTEGIWQTVGTYGLVQAHLWATLILKFNLITLKYVSVTLKEKEYDASSYGIRTALGPLNTNFIDLYIEAMTAGAKTVDLDNWLIT